MIDAGKLKKLLMVVNVDWFFLSHRLPIAKAALQQGYEVHLATGLTEGKERLEAYGFQVHPLQVDRSAAGPLNLLLLWWRLLRLFWRLRPDVLHLVTIKPVLLGGLAARLAPVRGVAYAISGLGHVFVAQGFGGRLRRAAVGVWYRVVLGARNMRVIFQNPDDHAALTAVARLRPDQVVMIPGSGVDLRAYPALPLPPGQPMVMMAARLLVTKGVAEFVQAAQLLKAQGMDARFCLVGDVDLANPASVDVAQLETWRQQGAVELLGHQADMAGLMAQASIVVLPSYREGLPKVLIEAAACGRAVVTTDVPGCRDAIEPNVTGLLVPARNTQALADAIAQLLRNPSQCSAMGLAGRQRAESLFDVQAVVQTHLALYQALLEET